MVTRPDSPYADLFCSALFIVLGIVMFIYRNQIGDFTGYYTGKYGYVDKPTPGCLLIPFALALIAGGVILIIRTITGP
ncbi:MAG: hypothetical protein HZA17_07090 [Nitrospirae bacterium]|nr:hypothetical protein [Nitrospirota bacterium]